MTLRPRGASSTSLPRQCGHSTVRPNVRIRHISRLFPVVVGVVVVLGGPAAQPARAQLGRLRDAASRAADEAKKAEEAKKKAEEAKKTSEDLAGRKAPASEPAAAAAPAAASPAAPAAAPAAAASTAGSTAAPFAAYSKYDFVPGEKVVAVEDFTQDAIGDFPARWNTNAAGEVVTIAGRPGRWLKLTRAGFFLPEFITELPDNFTLEFDLSVAPDFSAGFPLQTAIAQLTDPKKPAEWQSSPNIFMVTAHPYEGDGVSESSARQDGGSAQGNSTRTAQLAASRGAPVHISVWRQRQRLRVYMNQEKVWDVPRAASASAAFNSVVFFVPGGCGNCEYYLGNLRLATGAPDTRNKIVTEGKWVSHGILFDVNSDRIKGESYGSLKEVANVLTESPDLKVLVVGHTDSDGEDAANLDLSKRRAAAVKAALVSEFKIDAGRLETDGKGESQPIDKNDSAAGKANNRRVEFIKR
jgi:outer membrane protein OmpA-like peptidoglycan-associated protein